jgi:hypothetical protein
MNELSDYQVGDEQTNPMRNWQGEGLVAGGSFFPRTNSRRASPVVGRLTVIFKPLACNQPGHFYNGIVKLCTGIIKALRKNNLSVLAGPFGGWRRCSFVADRCGYAPHERLASWQNPCAIIAQVIFARCLSRTAALTSTF